MFKLKIIGPNKKKILESLEFYETKEYKYIVTNDPSHYEKDKTNIIFNDEEIEDIVTIIKNIIRGEEYFLNLENSLGIKRVNVREIDYFEAFDNDVFAIVGHERFYVLEKLYALEQALNERNFVRVSKSFLVNILKINYVKPQLNYKLELIMINGDTIDVNRTYIKSFKQKLNL
ncbi:MAG: LytTR family DNA-binding domain-containing protein [Bacilli bacterium]|jgi:DNA-binding LytR/AlgR family response regulator|nr:LytTR family DNA-binding domain-containing protein [Bacilli bacterium]MDD4056786.1 LytTR family DNA-binding domain-containing protein [Bacilli bacterium]MDY0209750.1 LytTR family DNA-binding domain-containing protein [Bacilli bacterium]